jgi:membrane protease YdiL (CAAX protease family)
MLTGAVLLAIAGWAFTFGLVWGNFWVKIGCTVAVITAYALCFRRPRIRFTFAEVGLGLASAVLLYGVFWLGNALSPYLIPAAHAQVGGIYGLGEGTQRIWIMLLLLFVTGPGEELFWRGFLQETLMERWGRWPGFLAATALYGGVHIFSMNLMLIGAACVAGAFWGLQYLWKRELASLIVSHSLWSAVIFAVLPIR